MYTVIGSPRTRAMRVLWALEEIGADYEIEPAPPQSAELRAVSPTGKSPVLRDGDFLLTDSTAILIYLSDKHDALTYPPGSQERARMNAALHFALDEFDGPLWMSGKSRFAMPEEYRLRDVDRTVQFELDLAMKRLGRMLGDGPWIMSERFTIADIVFGHCATWAKGFGFSLTPGPAAEYIDRVAARPALAKARERGAAAMAA